MKIATFAVVLSLAAVTGFAGFPSTEVFLPSVGRTPGNGASQWDTTVWLTNLSATSTVSFTFDFLAQGSDNTTPTASFTDSLQPGETKVYESVVTNKLGLGDALGAARITADGEILATERIFNDSAGAGIGATQGFSAAAIPKELSIGPGESATIQGVDQNGGEDVRTNFALVETSGSRATVEVAALDSAGTTLGQKSYALAPYEPIQANVDDVVPGFASTDARLVATVTSPAGSAILYGAQVANESQDPTGFEMSFPDLLSGFVTALNGLTGALRLEAGSNIAITQNGANALKISATVSQGPAGPPGPRGIQGPPGPPGPVDAVSTDTPNTAALRDGSGNFAMNTLMLDGNLNVPASSATAGVISQDGQTFIHSFGIDNTFVGSGAGNLSMTGNHNAALGSGTLDSNTSGVFNTAVGSGALTSSTTGTGNVAVGFEAMYNSVDASSNLAIGDQALFSDVSGDFNIAIGLQAGGLTTGSYNIDIGHPGVAGESHTMRLGDVQTATFVAGIRAVTTGSNDAVPVVIDSNGQLGTVSSSRRYKEDIRGMGDASDRLLRLRPVTFRYMKPFDDGQKPIQYGLIAEEVAEIFPDLVAYGRDRKPETVKYQMLSSLLLNEVQKQHAKIQDQAGQISMLKNALDEQRTAFAALAAKVSSLERNAAATELVRREVPAN